MYSGSSDRPVPSYTGTVEQQQQQQQQQHNQTITVEEAEEDGEFQSVESSGESGEQAIEGKDANGGEDGGEPLWDEAARLPGRQMYMAKVMKTPPPYPEKISRLRSKGQSEIEPTDPAGPRSERHAGGMSTLTTRVVRQEIFSEEEEEEEDEEIEEGEESYSDEVNREVRNLSITRSQRADMGTRSPHRHHIATRVHVHKVIDISPEGIRKREDRDVDEFSSESQSPLPTLPESSPPPRSSHAAATFRSSRRFEEDRFLDRAFADSTITKKQNSVAYLYAKDAAETLLRKESDLSCTVCLEIIHDHEEFFFHGHGNATHVACVDPDRLPPELYRELHGHLMASRGVSVSEQQQQQQQSSMNAHRSLHRHQHIRETVVPAPMPQHGSYVSHRTLYRAPQPVAQAPSYRVVRRVHEMHRGGGGGRDYESWGGRQAVHTVRRVHREQFPAAATMRSSRSARSSTSQGQARISYEITMEGWQGGVFHAPDNGPVGSRHFPVNIGNSKAAEKLGLRGSMWLQLAPGKHVALLTQRDWVIKWLVPLNSVRRYGTEKSVFSLEVGSIRPREQGVYFFQCPRAKEVFSVMADALSV